MLRRIDVPVDALVVYRRGAPHPELRAFRWGTRRYEVSQTNLIHVEREGEAVFLCYSVSCRTDHFHLRLDARRGRWMLEEIEVED